MLIKAEQKYIRMSPLKIRKVADSVRGISDPTRVVEHLQFAARRAAVPLSKTLKQAIANAKNNMKQSPENLKIREIQIGEGPRYKRFRAGSRGIAKPILKRTSHIRVILETKDDVKGGPSAKPSETERGTTQSQHSSASRAKRVKSA